MIFARLTARLSLFFYRSCCPTMIQYFRTSLEVLITTGLLGRAIYNIGG